MGRYCLFAFYNGRENKEENPLLTRGQILHDKIAFCSAKQGGLNNEGYYFSRWFRNKIISADKGNFKTDYAGV
jgi:hypothetical protein